MAFSGSGENVADVDFPQSNGCITARAAKESVAALVSFSAGGYQKIGPLISI